MERASLVNSHRYKVIQGEISCVCTSMLELLDKHLLPCASSIASKVYYMKVKGDYHRYLAEVLEGDDYHKAANDAIVAYGSGLQMAYGVYGPTHPLRLGLTLNFSVFYYEILDSAEKACSMTEEAIELVMHEYEALKLDEPLCEESMVFMGHLRQNMKMWTSEMQPKSLVSEDVARYRRAISF
ncbi:14-3-3-like protein G-BOX factor 14 kappa [Silene latifolia]|uniref:14-3-3-like protein G-BOX factor 14 kappa n=1 Tax=Silene latifolia TaxID=37657 RepID=UPI003D7730D9